jgi:hypothetical protein
MEPHISMGPIIWTVVFNGSMVSGRENKHWNLQFESNFCYRRHCHNLRVCAPWDWLASHFNKTQFEPAMAETRKQGETAMKKQFYGTLALCLPRLTKPDITYVALC